MSLRPFEFSRPDGRVSTGGAGGFVCFGRKGNWSDGFCREVGVGSDVPSVDDGSLAEVDGLPNLGLTAGAAIESG